MIARLAAFARQNWGMVSVLVLAVTIGLWFASRIVLEFLYFHDPAHVDVDLKPWMTPRFIVLTYDLPRPFVFEILDLDAQSERGERLRHVADELGLTMEELTEHVRARAADYRAERR